MEKSKAGKLNINDWDKILKGLGIAMGGAGSVYLLAILDFIDVGVFTPAIVAFASTGLNLLKKWLTDQNKS